MGFFALLVSILALEFFNAGTTYYAVAHLFQGATALFGVSWAVYLTTAFYLPDIIGLYSLVTGTKTRRNTWLVSLWALAATMNITLSWFALRIGAVEAGGKLLQAPAALSWGVALFLGLLRLGVLVAVFNAVTNYRRAA